MKKNRLPITILCGGLLLGLTSVSLMACNNTKQVTKYLVAYNVSDDFAINGIDPNGYASGDTVTFTITVKDSGKKVGKVTKDGETLTPTGDTYSFVMGEANATINVTLVPNIVVESVTIEGKDGEEVDTTIYDNSTIELVANVKTNGQVEGDDEVNWVLSDDSFASIEDGYLVVNNIGKDSEAKELTVTATSVYDETKTDSVTFTINHSLINFSSSYTKWNKNDLEGGGVVEGKFDLGDYDSDGEIIQDGEDNDTALMFSDVYGTKFYVETEFQITALSANDAFPKLGIMVGTNDDGTWNKSGMRHGFFYFDSFTNGNNQNWNTFAFIDTDTNDNWTWGSTVESTSRFTTDTVTYNEWVKIGLLRDGTDYYLLAGTSKDNYASFGIKRKITWDGIAADTPTYAWFGGWRGAFNAKNFRVLLDNEVEEEFGPTSISATSVKKLLYKGDTTEIQLENTGSYFDKNKLTYKSSDETLATVDENGVITAKDDIVGEHEVTITVTYENGVENPLQTEVKIMVTGDEKAQITFDGKLDDGLWKDIKSADKAYRLNIGVNNASDQYADFFARKNENGLYVGVDYYVTELKHLNDSNWWDNDNFEVRFGNEYGWEGGLGQIWASTLGGGQSNATEFGISEAVFNAETGLYNIQFEIFVPYTRFTQKTFTVDDTFGLFVGINNLPGWHAGFNWDNQSLHRVPTFGLYITEDGLSREYTCENHILTEVYDKLPTCNENGEKHQDCIHCDYVSAKEVIPASEEYHKWEVIEETTKSTCSTHGVGKAVCSICGEETTELPLDPNNHSAWNEETKTCADCDNLINEPVSRSLTTFTSDVYTHRFVGNADFSFTMEFNTTRTNDKTSSGTDCGTNMAFVGDICSENWANGGLSFHSSGYTWGSWGDINNSDYYSIVNNQFGNKDDASLLAAYADADVVLTVTYDVDLDRITCDAIVTSNVEGYEDQFAEIKVMTGAFDFHGNIDIKIGAECADITFYKAYINE